MCIIVISVDSTPAGWKWWVGMVGEGSTSGELMVVGEEWPLASVQGSGSWWLWTNWRWMDGKGTCTMPHALQEGEWMPEVFIGEASMPSKHRKLLEQNPSRVWCERNKDLWPVHLMCTDTGLWNECIGDALTAQWMYSDLRTTAETGNEKKQLYVKCSLYRLSL